VALILLTRRLVVDPCLVSILDHSHVFLARDSTTERALCSVANLNYCSSHYSLDCQQILATAERPSSLKWNNVGHIV
jgi:hypothetical protein